MSTQASDRDALMQGTLDLLILRILSLGSYHGQGVARLIQARSGDTLIVDHGSLYPALQRLEQREWIDSEWRTTDNNRRAKYYRLTAKGRRALSIETDSWRRYVTAVEDILAVT